jgi:hypothetical protein
MESFRNNLDDTVDPIGKIEIINAVGRIASPATADSVDSVSLKKL